MTNIFSDIPIWAIAAWGIFSFVLAGIYYRKKSWLKEVSQVMRLAMLVLRGAGLTILGILLANIIVQSTKVDTNDPLLITLIDDSSSMLNYKDSGEVKQQTATLLENIKSSFSDQYKPLTYSLKGSPLSVDSLNFKSSETNLSNALNGLYNKYYGRNIGALILVSDGNYNQGIRPTFVTEKFNNVPFYTVGTGDTVQKTDQLIENVVANDIAFLDNSFPIEVTVKGVKLPNEKFTITLLENGKEIDKAEYQHADVQNSLSKIKFLVDASSVGVQEYTIKISEQEDEYNVENNTARVYIEVLDDRSKILLLAEGLHPDLGAIKQALVTEQNLEVKVHTTADIDESTTELNEYDLVIWHNPGADQKPGLFDQIQQIDKPIWYITGPPTIQGVLNRLSLAPQIQVSGQTDNVGIAYNKQFNLFELSSNAVDAINEFPPVTAHYAKINYPKNGSILGYQKVGTIAKPEPLFFFGKKEQKYAVTFGNGLWNWRLGNYQQSQSHEAFDELIQKTVQYLILKENKSRLRISLPSTINTATNTIVDARFYNKSYQPITTPTINFKLSKKEGDAFDYAFLPLDDYYQLDLGKLDYGRYDWEASVTYDGETFKKSGSFAVEEVKIESQSTRADHQLLTQMAENQGGKFYTLEQANSLIEDIKSRKDISPVAYESSTYEKLINNFWWFVILIVVFTGEWVLRRYSGGY